MCDTVWRKKDEFHEYVRNSSNKAEIYRSLAPRAEGVQGPFYSLSSMSLAPIAKRWPDDCNNVNHEAIRDLQMIYINDLKDHSSTWVLHKDKIPSTT